MTDQDLNHCSFDKNCSDDTDCCALAEAIPALVFIADKTGQCLHANRRLLDFTGLAGTALLGVGWLKAVHQDDRPQLLDAWGSTVVDEALEAEFRLREVDGCYRWFLIRGAAVSESGRGVRWVVVCTEIDDRKRAEQTLAKSEAWYRSTFEHAAVGIAHVALDGRFLEVNDRFCAIVGQPRSRLLGRQFQSITHGDDIAADEANVAALLAGQTSHYSIEKRYVCREGSVIWVYLTVGLARDTDGTPKHFVSVIEDITHYKVSEERLTGMLLASGVVGWKWNPDTNRLFHKGDARVLFGDPPDSWDDFLETVHPEDRDAVRAAAATAMSGISYDVTFRVAGADGTIRWVRQRGQRWAADNGRWCIGGTITDVTEIKLAELAANEMSERLAFALEGASEGLWDWTVNNSDVWYSDRWCAMLGYDANEIEPHFSAWERLVHPDDKAIVLRAIQDHLDGQTAGFSAEHRLQAKSGKWMWILTRGKVVARDHEGRALRIAGTHSDVNARREAEEPLAKNTKRQTLLAEITVRLLQDGDTDRDVLPWLYERLREQFGVDAGLAFLTTPSGTALHLDFHTGISEPQANEVRHLVSGQAIFSSVAATGRSLHVTHVAQSDDPRDVFIRSIGLRAYACAPLIIGQRLLGTLSFGTRERDRFDDDDLTFFRTIANHVAIARERAFIAQSALSALDGIEAGVVVLDEDRCVRHWNRWLTQASGIPSEKALNDKLVTIWPSLDGGAFSQAVSDAFASGTSSLLSDRLHGGVIPLQRTDGRPLRHNILIRRFESYGKPLCLIQVHDISARVDAEAALRQSEERIRFQLIELEALYQNAPIGFALFDRDCRFLRVNRMLAEINGFPQQDHPGRSAWEIVPNLRESVEPHFLKTIEIGKAILGIEVHGITNSQPNVERDWIADFYPLQGTNGEVIAVGAIIREVTAEKRLIARERLLTNELQHRMKNLFAMVQALSYQTARSSHSVQDFLSRFSGRLETLAAAQDMLVRSYGEETVNLRDQVQATLAPFQQLEDRFVVELENASIPSDAASNLALALHELATNATKYGALSTDSGIVTLSTTIEQSDGRAEICLEWCETGGPEVTRPDRKGFGSRLLEQIIIRQNNGRVTMDWLKSGLACRICLPAPE